MSWSTPKTDWTPPDGVIDTDFIRIEENTAVLHKGNGQASLTTVASGNNLAINETDETFIITGLTDIHFIKTTGRQSGNKIILINGGEDNIMLKSNISSPPSEYAAIQIYIIGVGYSDITTYPKCALQLVYDGANWHYIS
jgi:hypothetical protein